MDYYLGVVTEYLRADRAIFVNTESLIQLDPGDVPVKDRHWYCMSWPSVFWRKPRTSAR